MIIPPIFQLCNADAGVRAALGVDAGGAVKLYPFDLAPKAVKLPYATWQNVAGEPTNNVSERPDSDKAVLQVNVWGVTTAQVLNAVNAISHAIELDCHITRWGNQSRDDETLAFGYDFDVDWFTHR